MTEAKRGLIRISSNYAGLLITMMFGLTLVTVLLSIGNGVFGAVALLGTRLGLAGMMKEIVPSTMIRELGFAHHRGRNQFLETYNTALLLSIAVATLIMGLFAALIFGLLPLLNFPETLRDAAQWFVLFNAIEIFFIVVLGPTFNMYLVEERMVALNGWRVTIQGAYLVAAVIVFVLEPGTEAAALVLYGVFSCALVSGTVLAACVWLLWRDPKLRPSPRRATWGAARSLLRIGGWNVAVLTAGNLHLRLDALVMNWFFGLLGNQVFGAASILSGYTGRTAAGMTAGLDAVSTRLSTLRTGRALHKLIFHATRLNGLAVFPTAAFVVVMAEPLVRVWIGRRLDDAAMQVPLIVMLAAVLLLGRCVRGISDAWVRVLYGAGHIRTYAPLILAGGVLNPLIAVSLIFVLPPPWNYAGPAISYSLILIVVHGILLPMVGARLLGIRVGEIFTPLLRPAILTIASAPVLLVTRAIVDQWDLFSLLVSLAVFGTAFGILALLFFFSSEERRRLVNIVRELSARRSDRRARTLPAARDR